MSDAAQAVVIAPAPALAVPPVQFAVPAVNIYSIVPHEDSPAAGDNVTITTMRSKRCKPTIECWGCINHFGPGCKHPKGALMWKTVEEQRNYADVRIIVDMVHAMFVRDIYDPGIAAGDTKMIPWPPHVIALHLDPTSGHMYDPVLNVQADVRDLTIVVDGLKSQLLFEDKRTGTVTAHHKNIDAFEKLVKVKLALIRSLKER